MSGLIVFVVVYLYADEYLLCTQPPARETHRGRKGFGFIKHNDSNKETFVNTAGLVSDIKEGDSVEFDLQEGKKGMNAVNVQVVG
jgi:CspA family cold shock protein